MDRQEVLAKIKQKAIEKMYRKAGVKSFKITCGLSSDVYPPLTAEKQLKIENVLSQNKKNYNKWIGVYREWVMRFNKADEPASYIMLEKTRAEALASLINSLWQDLTEEEKQQIKEILE
jgi:hypothetical protein